MPRDGSVQLNDVTAQYGVFVLAGPKARRVLARLADADLSNAAFAWRTQQEIPIGFCPKVRALRINFVGALGWELHHPIEYQTHLFDALMEAGRSEGIALVVLRAMESMRLEKSYRLWGSDLNAENSLLEAGLGRFWSRAKPAFVGREALLNEAQRGTLTTIALEVDADDADCFGNEPVILDGG